MASSEQILSVSGHDHPTSERDTTSTVPTCDLYLRFSDLCHEETFDKRAAKLRSLADALEWVVFRVVMENDMTPNPDGKLRPASAFKRKKIKTPSGRYEFRAAF